MIITGPGHGASEDPGRRYNMDECAEAATDVLASLDVIEPVDWVGNAWGGHVGVVFAARWPDGAGLWSRSARPSSPIRCPNACRSGSCCPSYVCLGLWASSVPAYETRCCHPGPGHDPGRPRSSSTASAGMNQAALINAVVSISLRRPDLTPRLAQIRCPTLFVTGSDHTGWTPEQAERASRVLADGAAEVIPNAATSSRLKPLIGLSNWSAISGLGTFRTRFRTRTSATRWGGTA